MSRRIRRVLDGFGATAPPARAGAGRRAARAPCLAPMKFERSRATQDDLPFGHRPQPVRSGRPHERQARRVAWSASTARPATPGRPRSTAADSRCAGPRPLRPRPLHRPAAQPRPPPPYPLRPPHPRPHPRRHRPPSPKDRAQMTKPVGTTRSPCKPSGRGAPPRAGQNSNLDPRPTRVIVTRAARARRPATPSESTQPGVVRPRRVLRE
jgi:hypothetical protein